MTAKVDAQLQYRVSRQFRSFYAAGGDARLSPDGALLFCAHSNVIRAVDVQTGVVKFTVGDEERDAQVTSFSLSADGSALIAAHESLLLKVWSLQGATATIDKTWKVAGKGPIRRIFQCSDCFFATGATDGSVKLWNLQLNTCIGGVRCEAGVISALCSCGDANSSSDLTIIYGTDTGTIWLWSPKSSHKTTNCELRYHSAVVTSLIVNKNVLYSSSRDMTIAVWDMQRRELKKTIPVFEAIECLLWSPKSEMALLSVGEKGVMKEIDALKGNVLRCGVPLRCRIVHLEHCAALNCYVAVGEDENFYLIDDNSWHVSRCLTGNNGVVHDLTFLSDEVLAVAMNSADIRLYNVATGSCQLIAGHDDVVLSVAAPKWSNSTLLSTSKDNTVRIWRIFGANDVRCVGRGRGHTASVCAAQWSNEARRFCVTAASDGTFKIFSVNNSWWTEAGEATPTTELSAALTQVAHDNGVSCAALSANDRLLATGSMDKTVKVWRIGADGRRAKLAGVIGDHRRGVWDVQFSTVDQVVASASGDLTVKIFSLSNFDCIRTFQGHCAAVLRVLFAGDGRTLLSTDGSGLLKLWDIKSSVCINTYDAHEGKLWSVALGGTKLATGGEDGNILIWDDVTTEKKVESETRRQEIVQQDQALSNLIGRRQYEKALRFALNLKRPRTALAVLKEMVFAVGKDEVEHELCRLSDVDMQILLSFAVEWNTNSRTYEAAQLVLSAVLRRYAYDEILKWPNAVNIVRDLLPYSSRHFDRLTSYREKLAVMLYIINCSSLVDCDVK